MLVKKRRLLLEHIPGLDFKTLATDWLSHSKLGICW
jgi:hypothetical protein